MYNYSSPQLQALMALRRGMPVQGPPGGYTGQINPVSGGQNQDPRFANSGMPTQDALSYNGYNTAGQGSNGYGSMQPMNPAGYGTPGPQGGAQGAPASISTMSPASPQGVGVPTRGAGNPGIPNGQLYNLHSPVYSGPQGGPTGLSPQVLAILKAKQNRPPQAYMTSPATPAAPAGPAQGAVMPWQNMRY